MLGNIFTGALLAASMRWIDRLLGIVSTLVLARLLTPADFGIIAMASVIMGLMDVLLDLGVIAMLIQKRDCDDEDFSNAWTVRVIECIVVAMLIILTAPLAADFYHDDRVAPVLKIMAISVLVTGFENVGVVFFQKDMQFGKDFQFFFLRRLVGFVAALALALWLQSYWALPLGALAGRLGGVALSYVLHPFRPRLTLSRFRQVWSFSRWMLLRNSGDYFASRLDKLLVGNRADAAIMGAYNLADEISVMPTSELLMPIWRVLFPALVKVRDHPEELQRAFLLAMAVQVMIAAPAAVGLAIVARDAVALLLGDQWMGAVPFVQVLALVYGLNAINFGTSHLLMALGRVHIVGMFVWVQILVFGLGAVTFLAGSGPLALAHWRLAVCALYTLAFLLFIFQAVPSLRPRHIYAVVWRPVVATAFMAGLLPFLSLEGWSPLPSLLVRCAVGGTLYGVALLLLWLLAERPRGAEAYVLDKLVTIFRRPVMVSRAPD
ncbi:MAG: polysaccharide biosynthesis protein [Rhodocyclaceae bacterium]|nr:polysaccharide biosynthesis protein [Rhodocyclaceae bacterium]